MQIPALPPAAPSPGSLLGERAARPSMRSLWGPGVRPRGARLPREVSLRGAEEALLWQGHIWRRSLLLIIHVLPRGRHILKEAALLRAAPRARAARVLFCSVWGVCCSFPGVSIFKEPLTEGGDGFLGKEKHAT